MPEEDTPTREVDGEGRVWAGRARRKRRTEPGYTKEGHVKWWREKRAIPVISADVTPGTDGSYTAVK